jgi:hypothetical protein
MCHAPTGIPEHLLVRVCMPVVSVFLCVTQGFWIDEGIYQSTDDVITCTGLCDADPACLGAWLYSNTPTTGACIDLPLVDHGNQVSLCFLTHSPPEMLTTLLPSAWLP